MHHFLRTLFISSIVLNLSVKEVQGQDYFQLSTNPVSLLYGVYKIELEVPVGNGWAVQPEVASVSEGQRFWIADYDTKGSRVGFVLKKYLNKEAPNEGYYGFAYFRSTNLTFMDFVPEGSTADQYDFDRRRNTFGFGLGYNVVGKDGFVLGGSIGLGRHHTNIKNYPDENNPPSFADDEQIFRTPLDVYARVTAGIRISNAKMKYEKEVYDQRVEEEKRLLLESMQNTTGAAPHNGLEERRAMHRLRNGNG